MRGLAKTAREYGAMEVVARERPSPATDEAVETVSSGEACKPDFGIGTRRT